MFFADWHRIDIELADWSWIDKMGGSALDWCQIYELVDRWWIDILPQD